MIVLVTKKPASQSKKWPFLASRSLKNHPSLTAAPGSRHAHETPELPVAREMPSPTHAFAALSRTRTFAAPSTPTDPGRMT